MCLLFLSCLSSLRIFFKECREKETGTLSHLKLTDQEGAQSNGILGSTNGRYIVKSDFGPNFLNLHSEAPQLEEQLELYMLHFPHVISFKLRSYLPRKRRAPRENKTVTRKKLIFQLCHKCIMVPAPLLS